MIKNYKNYFLLLLILFSLIGFLCFTVLICLPAIKESPVLSTSSHHTTISYPSEKRGSPTYDSIIGDDKLPHYRVFFWVPKAATSFVPYADEGVKTDVSSHGSVEKWSVEETQITDGNEKLVFVFVPKTFICLYGNGFEYAIHLKYS